MSVRSISFLLFASAFSDPCTDLCIFDGSAVCTKGSWTEKGVCRYYFYVGPKTDGNYCYHVAETKATCPGTGVPVAPADVEGLIARKKGTISTQTTTLSPSSSAPVKVVGPTQQEPTSRLTTSDTTTDSRPARSGQVLRGYTRMSGFDSLVVAPRSGRHDTTIFLLHGLNGRAEHMLTMGEESWMTAFPNAKFVSVNAPAGRWFLFDGIVADRNSLNTNSETLRNMIDYEASLLSGGHSRIFIVGYSQGGMISVYTTLMGGRRLGGLVMICSAVPVFDLGPISAEGKEVPIFHHHGLNDEQVDIAFARLGRRNAIAAGARFYDLVEQPGSHNPTSGVARSVTEWLRARI
jgi:predicted esterase